MKILKVVKMVAVIFLSVLFVRGIQVSIIENKDYDIFTILILVLMFVGIIGLVYSLYRDYKKKPQEERKEDNQDEKTTYITSDGILVDDNDNDSIIIYRPTGRFMTADDAKLADKGELPQLKQSNLILKSDEYCCFIGDGKTYKSKTVTTGYVSNRTGGSVRIMKGLTYHTGNSMSHAIRETQTLTFNGTIYITNKRIIYVSTEGEGFDKAIDKISSVEELQDGIMIQIGSKTYMIELDTHVLFMQVLSLVKNKEFGMELPEILSNPNVQYTTDQNVLNIGKQYKTNSTGKRKDMKIAYISLLAFLAIPLLIGFIISTNSKKNSTPIKDVYVENKQILSKFVELGYSNETSQEYVNILGNLGVIKINKIQVKDYESNYQRNDKLPKQSEYDILYYCEGDVKDNVCDFLIFIKNNEIICVCCSYGKFDSRSRYKNYEAYYTKEDDFIRKVISGGDIILDIAGNSNN